jgi:hypothetical protein
MSPTPTPQTPLTPVPDEHSSTVAAVKRVLALVAAVAMVGGAYLVRSRIIDSGDSSSQRQDTASGSVLTIGCAPELTNVCAAVASKDLRVLPDSIDIDEAASAASTLDAYLIYGPAPGIVNAAASDQAKVFDDGTVVGSGRLGVVAPADRVAALAKHCSAAKLTWACLVRSARSSWSTIAPTEQFQGSVKIGVGKPNSALSAILVAPLALATAKVQDPGIEDIDTKAVARVVASVDQQASEDELTALTTQGPAAYSAVVAPAAQAQQAAASTRGQGLGLTVIYPEPVARTVVVLAPPSGHQVPKSILDAFDQPNVRRALASAGWNATRRGTSTGLPASDVLFALRRELTP